jgi:hypothetical protein
MLEIQSPNPFRNSDVTVFLGGSIEMGKADHWQKRIVAEFANEQVVFLNPRRDDWDWTWEQSIHNPKFLEQVTWEMNAQEYSDIIIYYFDPNAKSPITLLELGLHAKTGKVLVCCPEGFWRKGNVEIVCEKYAIPLYDTYDQLVEKLREAIKK